LHECRTAEEVREHYKAVRARTNLWKAPPPPVDCVDSVRADIAKEVTTSPVAVAITEEDQETQVTIHRQEPEPKTVVVHPSIARVADTVAARFGKTRAEIVSHRRTADIMRPRQITMYLARTLTLRSLPEIGYYLGDRDHSTIIHGVRKIEKQRAEDPELDALLVELSAILGAG